MSDDDDLWFESLAGRATAAASEATREESSALRSALQDLEEIPFEQPPTADLAREEALLSRARAAGLLPHGTALARPARAPAAPGRLWRGVLAAAAVGALAVGFVLLRPLSQPPAVERSAGAIVRLNADNPARLQQELIGELRSAGVAARGYEMLGRRGVDADLPRPLPDAVRAVLERHGIPAPRDGVLQVEIEGSGR
jgi:hypothetical protein